MKKIYSKPTAQLVDFSLSTSIAGTCGPGAGQDLNGWDVLLVDAKCSVGTNNDDFCKNVPTADESNFVS